MPTIANVVKILTASPKPVICLDTCDILEVVQCLDWEKSDSNTPRMASCVEPVRRLLDKLYTDANFSQLVITDLVHIEWNQNIGGIRKKAEAFIKKIDDIVKQTSNAAGFVRTFLPVYPPLVGSTLVADLVDLSTELLNQATRLNLDNALNKRAIERVKKKERPSHDGHVKDSINFEHYLELARCLRAGGYTEEVVFVSKNKKDYWKGDYPQIHPDLKTQIDDPTAKIKFFGSIEAALGYLNI